MNLILLASLILLCSVMAYQMNRHTKQQKSSDEAYWERERRSNFVRRKPLDNLEYITIPLERFPTQLLRENTAVIEIIDTLETLSGQPIVNFTGYSNTDLKLEYGTANITLLMEYDQNYTLLVRNIQKWAEILLDAGYTEEAQGLLEYAVTIRTDVSRTYYKLAEIYSTRLETEKVRNLIAIAGTLRSSHKDTIVRTLQESYL